MNAIEAHWWEVKTDLDNGSVVNIGSGNGNKPLAEPVLSQI